MAESNSVVFRPPQNHITENDPMITRVPMDKVDFANRKSQQPALKSEGMSLKHVMNGGKS